MNASIISKDSDSMGAVIFQPTTPVKSPNSRALDTLLDTPGLQSPVSSQEDEMDTAMGPRIIHPTTPSNSRALDTLLDTPGLQSPVSSQDSEEMDANIDIQDNNSEGIGIYQPTTSALDSLLDSPGLPDTLLATRTPGRQLLGLLTLATSQVMGLLGSPSVPSRSSLPPKLASTPDLNRPATPSQLALRLMRTPQSP